MVKIVLSQIAQASWELVRLYLTDRTAARAAAVRTIERTRRARAKLAKTWRARVAHEMAADLAAKKAEELERKLLKL